MTELYAEFLDNWGPQFIDWLLSDGIAILFLLILLKVSLWLLRVIVNRLKKLHIARLLKSNGEDSVAVEKRMNTIYGIIRQAAKIAIYTIIGLTILTHLGIAVGPILASVGVLGLALGFGSQELVRDVVSGLFNLIENNIRVGDVVSINGVGGAVEKVELRTTVLRGYDGTIHVFQNGKINTLSNLTKDWSAAAMDIGVGYDSDLNQVINVMRKVGESLQKNKDIGSGIIEPIEIAGLDNYGESALIVKARIKTAPGSQWGVKRQYLKDLKVAFDKEGISIPFPHRTLVYDQTGAPNPKE